MIEILLSILVLLSGIVAAKTIAAHKKPKWKPPKVLKSENGKSYIRADNYRDLERYTNGSTKAVIKIDNDTWRIE